MPQKERKMKPKDIPEAQIAWVLCNVLEEITERLWLRYGKNFIRLEKEQEEEEVGAEERAKDPDLLAQDDF
jgi:hypothetical protein